MNKKFLFIIACEEEIAWNSKNNYISDYVCFVGIGKINATFNLFAYLKNNYEPKDYANLVVINIGTAGQINKSQENVDCFICQKCYFHDVNLESFGYQIGQMAGKNTPKFYPTDSAWNKFIGKKLDALKIKYKLTSVATGDKFVENLKDIEKLTNIYSEIHLVDMEAAALAFVCEKLKIPFTAIKFVSDNVNEDDNYEKYNEFCKQNPIRVFDIINTIINQ